MASVFLRGLQRPSLAQTVIFGGARAFRTPSINKVQLIGRLGSDPKFQVSQNDQEFARLSICTNRYQKREDGSKIDIVDWHEVVVFPDSFVQRIKRNQYKKGDTIFVDGKLQTSERIDPNSNSRTKRVSVVVNFDGNVLLINPSQPKQGKEQVTIESFQEQHEDQEALEAAHEGDEHEQQQQR